MSERLANLSWQSVLVIVAVLLCIRFLLMRVQGDFAKSIAEIAESLAVAMALVFFLIRPFLVQAFFIPSGSMHPTLLEDDHILVNKLGYRFFQPRTGDVVVFKAPPDASEDGEEKDYIKRLIATPGDTVEIRGAVFKVGAERKTRQEVFTELSSPRDIVEEPRVKYLANGVLLNGRLLPKERVAQAFDVKPADLTIYPGKTILNGKVLDEPYTAEDPDYDLPRTKIDDGYLLVLGDNRNNSNDGHRWGPLERKRLLGKAMFIFWPLNRVRIVD
jgi:signal peptidase I